MGKHCLSLRYGLWFCLLFLAPPCFGQTIVKLRIINTNNGNPLKSQQILVNFLYGKGEERPTQYQPTLRLETNASGEAQFNLPELPPSHLSFVVHLASEHWHCACLELAETQNVIQDGIVVGGVRNELRIHGQILKAKPGEVLFVARPFTFLEKLLNPFVKG